MRTLALSTVLAVFCLCSAAALAGSNSLQATIPASTVRLQSMQINETLRMKVVKAETFDAAGLKDLKQGDEVEVKRLPENTLEVKHLQSGQTGSMPAPK